VYNVVVHDLPFLERGVYEGYGREREREVERPCTMIFTLLGL